MVFEGAVLGIAGVGEGFVVREIAFVEERLQGGWPGIVVVGGVGECGEEILFHGAYYNGAGGVFGFGHGGENEGQGGCGRTGVVEFEFGAGIICGDQKHFLELIQGAGRRVCGGFGEGVGDVLVPGVDGVGSGGGGAKLDRDERAIVGGQDEGGGEVLGVVDEGFELAFAGVAVECGAGVGVAGADDLDIAGGLEEGVLKIGAGDGRGGEVEIGALVADCQEMVVDRDGGVNAGDGGQEIGEGLGIAAGFDGEEHGGGPRLVVGVLGE